MAHLQEASNDFNKIAQNLIGYRYTIPQKLLNGVSGLAERPGNFCGEAAGKSAPRASAVLLLAWSRTWQARMGRIGGENALVGGAERPLGCGRVA